jgi:hypothetical protein
MLRAECPATYSSWKSLLANAANRIPIARLTKPNTTHTLRSARRVQPSSRRCPPAIPAPKPRTVIIRAKRSA